MKNKKTMNRNRNRNRYGGGIFDNLTNSFTGLFSSKSKPSQPTYKPSQSTYQPTYEPTYKTSQSTYQTSQPTYQQTNQSLYSYNGGKRRNYYTLKRNMRGGFEANNSSSNLAFYASPYNGADTSQPQSYVGGKNKKNISRRRKRNISRRRNRN